MRVGMELAYVLNNKSLKRGEFNLDGRSSVVLLKSKDLRLKVMSWFTSGLDTQVDGMGECLDLKERSIPLTRKRLILMDLMERRKSRDPKNEEEEEAMVSSYIKDMITSRTMGSEEFWASWGGTPELVAFAHMSKRPIRVFRQTATGLEKFQEFVCPDTDDSVIVNLLHESSSLGGQATHYSTLVTAEEVKVLCERFGELKVITQL
jgi:hypothetical protein